MSSAAEIAQNESSDRSSGAVARWYAVHCRPHREGAARNHLARQGYDVFLPLQERMRRHARRIDKVRRPFFPGYLFVQLDITRDAWRPINGTVGVLRIVMQGEAPAPAPRGAVEALKARCNADDILSWQPSLEPGQAVKITAGPFADLVGALDRLDGPQRVRVLLNLLGGDVPVWLSRSDVLPADSLV